jgi:hypothetical protein
MLPSFDAESKLNVVFSPMSGDDWCPRLLQLLVEDIERSTKAPLVETGMRSFDAQVAVVKFEAERWTLNVERSSLKSKLILGRLTKVKVPVEECFQPTRDRDGKLINCRAVGTGISTIDALFIVQNRKPAKVVQKRIASFLSNPTREHHTWKILRQQHPERLSPTTSSKGMPSGIVL